MADLRLNRLCVLEIGFICCLFVALQQFMVKPLLYISMPQQKVMKIGMISIQKNYLKKTRSIIDT